MSTLQSTKICANTGKPCPRDVRPQNAARAFKNPAPILSKCRIGEVLAHRKGGTLIEIGAGCLRNALYLQRKLRVTVLEVPMMESRFPDAYAAFKKAGGSVVRTIPADSVFDFALATFVIETICPKVEREAVVRTVFRVLRPRGCFILSVRGPSDVVTANTEGKRCDDGFTTPNKTFVRPHTRTQLQRFLRKCGFRNVEFLHKPNTKQPELLYAIAWK